MLTRSIYIDLEKNHGLRLGSGPLAGTSLGVNKAFVHGDTYLVPRGRLPERGLYSRELVVALHHVVRGCR